MTEFEGEDNKHDELRKLATIATDMELSNKMRSQAVDQLGEIGTHESLLILLNLVANDRLNTDERERALKQAHGIVKKGI